jgi:hypothetical protein
MDVIVITEV